MKNIKKKPPTMDSEMFGQSVQILRNCNKQNLLKKQGKHELDSKHEILLQATNSATKLLHSRIY